MNILLTEILNTREARAARQQALLREHHCAVAFFTMNIAGLRLYRELGISGIRGEMAQGLPSVANTALPVFRAAQLRGLNRNVAGVVTLLHLIAHVQDTNLYHRGEQSGANFASDSARELLKRNPYPAAAQVEVLDDAFIARNLSPGGCADLLAATYFLDKLL